MIRERTIVKPPLQISFFMTGLPAECPSDAAYEMNNVQTTLLNFDFSA
jgi:hypothetical protein